MYNLNMAQTRALKAKKEIEKICIANYVNLTIHDGKIGFVDPITNKIVLLWNAEYKQEESEE